MGNEDREPPASSPSDQHDTFGERCEYCGTSINTSDWYPVTKQRDSDGSIRLYSFCSEDCQDAWLDEHQE